MGKEAGLGESSFGGIRISFQFGIGLKEVEWVLELLYNSINSRSFEHPVEAVTGT